MRPKPAPARGAAPAAAAAPAGPTGDTSLIEALVARATEPAPTAAAREHAVIELVALSGGRREPLEAVRARLQRRIGRRSDDFSAINGLRLVTLALARVPRPDGPNWQARVHGRRERRAR